MQNARDARPIRNELAQYDELADEWWRPGGAFAMLRWIAAARGRLVPPATRRDAVLVDLGCGAGLLTPYVAGKGYQHIGVDLVTSALRLAAPRGVRPIRADVTRLPLPDGCADVVSAGELLEHVVDRAAAVAETCRILRPGGLVVLDTLNATALSRLLAVTVAERVPGGAPPGIHDPNLFVPPDVLVDEFARGGVQLDVRGIRPAMPGLFRWLVTRRGDVKMVRTFSTAVLYQGRGVRQL